MPKQKLIRLTSDTQDGIFSSMFNEDILIKKDSDIALQSLSVERKSDKIVISNDNSNIEYGVVLPELGVESTIIPSGVYDKNTNNRLLQSITNGLNRDASMVVNSEQMGTEWGVDVENGYVTIKGTTLPFFPLSVYDDNTDDGLYNTVTRYNGAVENNIANGESVEIQDTYGGLGRPTATTTGNANECYAFGGTLPFIKSTGSLRLRLQKLVADAVNDKAFTFGLMSKTAVEKCQNGTITEADLTYAIRVKQPNAGGTVNFEVKNGFAADFVATTFAPVNYSGDVGPDENDILEIVIDSGNIQGQHWTMTGSNVFDSYNTTDGEDLYWGLFLFDSKTTCVVDMVSVSLSRGNLTDSEVKDVIFDNPQSNEGETESEVTGYIEFEKNVRKNPSFHVTKDVFQHLGFENTVVLLGLNGSQKSGVQIKRLTAQNIVDPIVGNTYDFNYMFSWQAQSIFDNSYSSDTYLLECQTFQLDSFDSYGLSPVERNAQSGGSRRNLLATIPISEVPISGTSNGLIQYSPNNMFYISIKNRGDVNTRQIKFRLLTGTYDPVLTSGLASITILIRDPEA